jgi:hypothetical protein
MARKAISRSSLPWARLDSGRTICGDSLELCTPTCSKRKIRAGYANNSIASRRRSPRAQRTGAWLSDSKGGVCQFYDKGAEKVESGARSTYCSSFRWRRLIRCTLFLPISWDAVLPVPKPATC